MRDLTSYSIPQWLVLTPLVHRLKLLRNRTLERYYRQSGAAQRDRFLSDYAQSLGSRLAVTIAFNAPWAIELFLRSARKNLSGFSVIVADNSSNAQVREEIAALCSKYEAGYAALPRNPEWHPNRSHGVAMNWAFYNLVEPLDPDVFAFLDHDMVVLSPFDLAETVARQPIYGRYVRSSVHEAAWSLWAGYSVFDHSAVKDRNLDFNYDEPLRLDTGGNNWGRVYRHLDPGTMRFSEDRWVRFQQPHDESIHSCVMHDSFAHVGSGANTPASQAARIAFFRGLVEHVEAGGNWEDFVVAAYPLDVAMRWRKAGLVPSEAEDWRANLTAGD